MGGIHINRRGLSRHIKVLVGGFDFATTCGKVEGGLLDMIY